jgi:hypothetical protein
MRGVWDSERSFSKIAAPHKSLDQKHLGMASSMLNILVQRTDARLPICISHEVKEYYSQSNWLHKDVR